jgi:hypothetical protein
MTYQEDINRSIRRSKNEEVTDFPTRETPELDRFPDEFYQTF